MGLFKRLFSIGPAQGPIIRFKLSIDTNPTRASADPFLLLTTAWDEAIETYRTREPKFFSFVSSTEVRDTICRVFSLVPIDRAVHFVPRIIAGLAYPAYSDTPEAQQSFALLSQFIASSRVDLAPYNTLFAQCNPVTASRPGAAFRLEEVELLAGLINAWARAQNLSWSV